MDLNHPIFPYTLTCLLWISEGKGVIYNKDIYGMVNIVLENHTEYVYIIDKSFIYLL